MSEEPLEDAIWDHRHGVDRLAVALYRPFRERVELFRLVLAPSLFGVAVSLRRLGKEARGVVPEFDLLSDRGP
jgi:hypothetical protein